ncbi:hypothetical protein QW71_34175 [Paenibacillus sp. IHB B 3415]|uniref:hypothetical protein n=1 Tax=Paenibacillus sp. IHB B 3415 TaxID=867080 RepID=UPI000573E126|nr:hypothetical protein [Paenibacillus sp. IHB B 3415]KHL91502.1 hypothetical protein QW71_34175 [Paenibacillus sp. IHB B 3415]
MDKNRTLDELFGAMKALYEMNSNESPVVYAIGNIWNAVKEICEFEVQGPLSEKILEYVLERLEKSNSGEDRFENLIAYLTTSKIEMNED